MKIDNGTRRRMANAASKLGLTVSSVIRLALTNQLAQIDRGVIEIHGASQVATRVAHK